MQMCNGLMRYHSAPSSILAGLLNEDILPRDPNSFSQVEDSELARFLDDHLCSMPNPHIGSKPLPSSDCNSLPPFIAEEAKACLTDIHQPPCLPHGCSKSIKDVFRGPLSSIAEFHADESNKLCSTFHINAQRNNTGEAPHSKPNPPSAWISNGGVLAHVKSNLAWNKGNGETVLNFGGPLTQALEKGSKVNHVGAWSLLPAQSISYASKREDGKGVFVEANSVKSPADERKSGLLRQNSSPAGLLSQISVDGMSSSTFTKLSSSPLSSEEERRGEAYKSARFWDEIGSDEAGHVHRKRGREGHGVHILQSSESSFTNLKAPHVVGDGLVSMEVLCRVSAKRGCATHPRSIAERVRRTKINEGIRKLQELMPNMEKQISTVTMLDEAVEYVKFLRRRVQELSAESRPKCNGRCHSK